MRGIKTSRNDDDTMLSLALFVARVLADDPHYAFAPDKFAVFANSLY